MHGVADHQSSSEAPVTPLMTKGGGFSKCMASTMDAGDGTVAEIANRSTESLPYNIVVPEALLLGGYSS